MNQTSNIIHIDHMRLYNPDKTLHYLTNFHSNKMYENQLDKHQQIDKPQCQLTENDHPVDDFNH